jgi:hypothetical protein
MPSDQHSKTKDELLGAETEVEQATGLRGPLGWRGIGLIVLAVLVAIVLALQLMGGNPGTAVIPGTSIAAPQGEVSR